jgi:hypothetical protein
MDDTLYGCLALQVTGPHVDLARLVGVDDPIRWSNHLSISSEIPKPFDYWHGGVLRTETSKVYVPAIAATLTGYRVGTVTNSNLTKKIIQNLLHLNIEPDNSTENATYLEKAYQNVFLKTKERLFVSLDINTAKMGTGKFLLMSRHIQVNLLIFCNKTNTYLLWTNEQDIEDRMRLLFGEEYYYYRAKPILNRACVIHSLYLQTKFRKWKQVIEEPLKLFNALDYFLSRRSMG